MGRCGWINSKHLSTQLAVNPSPISSQTSCTFRHMNPLWHTGLQHVHLRYSCNLAFDYGLHCDIRNKTSMLCNSNLWNLMHKKTAGNYSKHNFQDMSLSAPSLQKYLMRHKYCSLCECTLPLNAVAPFGMSSPAGREGSLSRPQQDAKFQYASTI